jgi:hypothetical protein
VVENHTTKKEETSKNKRKDHTKTDVERKLKLHHFGK